MGSIRNADLPLSAYALIGDGRTAALVATDGSVDWLCYGRFDGPAVFCRLLDRDRGGYLQVCPEGEFAASRRYVGNTNVLETEFRCAGGVARLTDCMPPGVGDAPVLLRKLEGLAGEVRVRIAFVPTFDFVRKRTLVDPTGEGCLAHSGELRLRLASPAPMSVDGDGARGAFKVKAGQTCWLVVTHGEASLAAQDAEEALRGALRDDERWSARGNYPSPYSALLRRSALALKLLIHAPTGAMIAAPTTSLPEAIGGARNWDYRFSWLRDASWVVSSLMELGFHDEGMAFVSWLESLKLAKRGPAVLYDVDGGIPGEEHELWHLSGYRASRPVRVGNAAAWQDQHDVFGEVIEAVHLCWELMPSMRPLPMPLWNLVSSLADRAAEHWEHADHGMWEVREQRRHFLSSKLLSWVALDRALAIAQADRHPFPAKRWSDACARLRQLILTRGFDPLVGSFTRAFGDRELDAFALLLPRHGILPADEPRMLRTVAAVGRELSAGGGLLRRYAAADGLPGSEGAFAACSFWLADCLARQRRLDEAHDAFERVVAHASDLGLLSEEIEPHTGELLGNYPQAFSHLALIRAAMSIDRAEERSRRSPRPSPTKAEDRRLMRGNIFQGAAAGAAATAAMSAVMLTARRAGLAGKLPPEKITEKMLDALRIRRSEPAEDALATVTHFGYGSLAGAIFESLLRGRLWARRPMLEGVAFAAAVWAGSYFGWVPSLGVMPRPTRDRPGRGLTMALAHVVFGAVLGWLAGARRLPRALEVRR